MVVDVVAVGCWVLVLGRVLLADMVDLLFDGNCCWMIAGAVAVGCWMLVRGGFCWMMWTTCCLLLVVAGCIDESGIVGGLGGWCWEWCCCCWSVGS